MAILENQLIVEDLGRKGFKALQFKDGFKFGTDSVLLSLLTCLRRAKQSAVKECVTIVLARHSAAFVNNHSLPDEGTCL